MKRRLPALLTALTLPWSLAAIVLWVRSPGRGEFFGTETVSVTGGRGVRELRGVWSGGARLMVGAFKTDSTNAVNVQTLSALPQARGVFRHIPYGVEPYPRWGSAGPPRWEGPLTRLGFYANRYKWSGPSEFGGYAYVTVPHWFAATLAGAPGVWWLLRFGRRRRLARLRNGLCPSCGYNLTGNVSGVCPECGVDYSASLTSKSKSNP